MQIAAFLIAVIAAFLFLKSETLAWIATIAIVAVPGALCLYFVGEAAYKSIRKKL